ncbi:MAG: hypothetical protein HFG00_11150 [Oscillibacter sp.]|nr:hypothetical protein [Oscillibacter sp.]
MTANDTAVRPQRRAGTLTLGLVLITAGTGMLVSLFWPALEIRWLLKASPLILVVLGIEVLLSARGGGKVKYDWLGMLLCFILVGAGLAMYTAAWAFENLEYFNAYDCSRYADQNSYRMDYGYFDGFDSHTLHLESGDTLDGRIDTYGGRLEVTIRDGDGNTLFEEASQDRDCSLEISQTGEYTIIVHGQRASGQFVFERTPAEQSEASVSQPDLTVPEEDS